MRLALFILTRRVTRSGSAGCGAGLLYALDPYFVRQSSSFIELPFVLPLFLWSVERLTAVRHVAGGMSAGALLGLTWLTRASLLPAGLGLLAVLCRRRGWGRRHRQLPRPCW